MKQDSLLLAGAVLAGVSVTSDAEAASMTVESSFVNSFENESYNAVEFEFDPFMGPAGSLTGVTMTLDSLLAPGVPFANTVLIVSKIDGPIVNASYVNSGTVEYDFVEDLFALGIAAADFVGGPVAFRTSIDVEEAVSTGVWFAGEDPTGGGGGGGIIAPADFGSVTLTYYYDDVPEVPLSGSLAFLGSGLAVLGATRRRLRKRE